MPPYIIPPFGSVNPYLEKPPCWIWPGLARLNGFTHTRASLFVEGQIAEPEITANLAFLHFPFQHFFLPTTTLLPKYPHTQNTFPAECRCNLSFTPPPTPPLHFVWARGAEEQHEAAGAAAAHFGLTMVFIPHTQGK